MTKYEPGVWYGWNGGEMPVHPETVVEIATRHGTNFGATGNSWIWDNSGSCPIIAFRIVREYREPREWWVEPNSRIADHYTDENPSFYEGWIHVREVIDGEDQA